MGQALYRKYRPKKLADISGQKHIVTVLNNAIKKDKISHAYLFTGPRGVGKTSIARILAHEINSLPYEDEKNHIDIIEIDAASNRRIDEIRDLREKVNISPAEALYKVYIIDEVHMLTKEAFNALLKTLEEPPKHVVFILATTDAHKVPETIISRTQRFVFKPIEITEMTEQILEIAKSENIQIDKPTAQSIAAYGRGSFRDSLSLLDQLSASAEDKLVQEALVNEIVGRPDEDTLNSLTQAILNKRSPAEILSMLESAYSRGSESVEVARAISQKLRQKVGENELEVSTDLIDLLDSLLLTQSASTPQAHLELAIFRYVGNNQNHVLKQSNHEVKTHEKAGDTTEESKTNVPSKINNKSSTGKFGQEHWTLVLDDLKTKHNTLYGVIRMAEPRFSDDKLTLAFEFGFHQKRASEQANYQKLIDIINQVSGQTLEIEAIVDKNSSTNKQQSKSQNTKSSSVETISNIFDGAELLES